MTLTLPGTKEPESAWISVELQRTATATACVSGLSASILSSRVVSHSSAAPERWTAPRGVARCLVRARLLLARGGDRVRFQEAHQVFDVARPQPQVGHADLLVFVVQGARDGVAAGQHFVGLLDVARDPRALAPCSHAGQVRPELVAFADGVARTALAREQALAVRHRDRLRLRVACAALGVPAEEGAHPRGEEARVVHGREARPLPVCRAADDQVRRVMALAAGRIVAVADQRELVGDGLHVLGPSGEEGPVGAELLGVGFQRFRRIALRIDRDRVQVDVAAGALAQHLLQLHHVGGFERAHVLAGGEDGVDRHLPALEHIVVEADLLPLVRGELDVGEVVRTTLPGERGGGAHQQHDRRRAGAFHRGKFGDETLPLALVTAPVSGSKSSTNEATPVRGVASDAPPLNGKVISIVCDRATSRFSSSGPEITYFAPVLAPMPATPERSIDSTRRGLKKSGSGASRLLTFACPEKLTLSGEPLTTPLIPTRDAGGLVPGSHSHASPAITALGAASRLRALSTDMASTLIVSICADAGAAATPITTASKARCRFIVASQSFGRISSGARNS